MPRNAGGQADVVIDDEMLGPPSAGQRRLAKMAVPLAVPHVPRSFVLDQDAIRLLGDAEIIVALDADAAARIVEDRVLRDRDVGHSAPVGGVTLVPRRQGDAAVARVGGPEVLHGVAVDEHALGVLQLEEVLHRVAARRLPRGIFAEIIAADLDVSGDHLADQRVRAAEHDVLPAASR